MRAIDSSQSDADGRPPDGYFLRPVGHTEEEIWAELIARGFPVGEDLDALLGLG